MNPALVQILLSPPPPSKNVRRALHFAVYALETRGNTDYSEISPLQYILRLRLF